MRRRGTEEPGDHPTKGQGAEGKRQVVSDKDQATKDHPTT